MGAICTHTHTHTHRVKVGKCKKNMTYICGFEIIHSPLNEKRNENNVFML